MNTTKSLKQIDHGDYIIFENENGTTYHVKKNFSGHTDLSEEFIRDEMAKKEKAIKNAIKEEEGLITYDKCVELGFCDYGIKVFARMAGIPDDKVKHAVLTQEEYDAIVTKYQKLLFKDAFDILSEVLLLAKNVKWDMDFILSKPEYAFMYARHVVGPLERAPECVEDVIKKEPRYAYSYLSSLVNHTGRFPEFEESIKQDPDSLAAYLLNVVRISEPIPELEDAVRKCPSASLIYLLHAYEPGKRYPEWEDIILQSPQATVSYLERVWEYKGYADEKFERVILQDALATYTYLRSVVELRGERASKKYEDVLRKAPHILVAYLRFTVRKHCNYPEFEDVISTSYPSVVYEYLSCIATYEGRVEKFEDALTEDAIYAYEYLVHIAKHKGRFPKYEKVFYDASDRLSYLYLTKVCGYEDPSWRDNEQFYRDNLASKTLKQIIDGTLKI